LNTTIPDNPEAEIIFADFPGASGGAGFCNGRARMRERKKNSPEPSAREGASARKAALSHSEREGARARKAALSQSEREGARARKEDRCLLSNDMSMWTGKAP
jgi:hypothetical protein